MGRQVNGGMRSPFRLVEVQWKLAYLVGAAIIVLVVPLLVRPLSRSAVEVVVSSVGIGLIYLATRVFRGEDEPRDPPRAPWRMTARPLAGFILGGLFALRFANVAILFALALVFRTAEAVEDLILWLVLLAGPGALAYLYLASSIRLRRGSTPGARPRP